MGASARAVAASMAPNPALAHRYPSTLSLATAGPQLCRWATRSRTRGLTGPPSGSPMTRAPAPPSRMTPGSMTSAKMFTKAATVRAAPSRWAIRDSLKPFCRETT